MPRRSLAPLLALALAACAGAPEHSVHPVASGGSKSDGVVTMSSTAGIYVPVAPNLEAAAADAARRCRAWGYDRTATFEGWQEACRRYDRHGRCVYAEVTRFYSCSG
jgi:hypothetical protein